MAFQEFISETKTPSEDGAVAWMADVTPSVDVATLVIPQNGVDCIREAGVDRKCDSLGCPGPFVRSERLTLHPTIVWASRAGLRFPALETVMSPSMASGFGAVQPFMAQVGGAGPVEAGVGPESARMALGHDSPGRAVGDK